MTMGASTDERPLVILGAGGHAKVLLSLIQAVGLQVLGVCDPALAAQRVSQWRGNEVLGGDEALVKLDPSTVWLVNGVGQQVGASLRRRIFDELKENGFRFRSLVHPAAWVDSSVVLGEGAQVMAGAVIQPDSVIGVNTIVNTRASIDHDCRLGSHVHVAPGATLCGGVRVEDHAFIASGATVIQGMLVGEDSVVGAGAVLVRDLAARQVLLGSAVRKMLGPSE